MKLLFLLALPLCAQTTQDRLHVAGGDIPLLSGLPARGGDLGLSDDGASSAVVTNVQDTRILSSESGASAVKCPCESLTSQSAQYERHEHATTPTESSRRAARSWRKTEEIASLYRREPDIQGSSDGRAGALEVPGVSHVDVLAGDGGPNREFPRIEIPGVSSGLGAYATNSLPMRRRGPLNPLRISQAALLAGITLDAVSTELALRNPMAYEANPWQRNRAVRIGTHVAMGAGLLWVQKRFIKTDRERKWATVANYALAAGFMVVSGSNFRVASW